MRAPLLLRPGAYDGLAEGRRIRVATVLPGIAPAQVREDGEVWLAVQVAHRSGDSSRDLAEALRLALVADAGQSVAMAELPGRGPRLQDVVDPHADLEVTVLEGFNFWFDGVGDDDGTRAATLERLNSSINRTSRLGSVQAAYWTSVGAKEHLRWVMPHDEDALLTALARLHVAGADSLGPETRLVGSFRAHGLLVPVWDLRVGTGPESVEAPAAALAERLGEAIQDASPLSGPERSARNGLSNRQVTIR